MAKFKASVDIEVDIKPCPFCGSAKVETDKAGLGYYVKCKECYATGPYSTGNMLPGDAVIAWNERWKNN